MHKETSITFKIEVMKKKVLFLTLACVFYSCSQEFEDLTDSISVENSINPKTFISQIDTNNVVDSNKAIYVAQTFTNQLSPSRSLSKEIKDVTEVKNEQGNTSFYIVNFKNNNGFVIVSSTQDYMPILAYSEYGKFVFDESINNGVNLWLQEQKYIIENVSNIDEELKREYRRAWSQYNITKKELNSTRSDDDVYTLINDSIRKWQLEGYNVFRYSEIRDTEFFYGFPQDFITAIRNAVDSAHPKYGGRDSNTFILTRRKDYFTKDELPFKAKWGQDSPYNQFIPNGYDVGCVAVAMGQIMKYYEYPTKYSWDLMPDSYGTSTTAQFLYEVGLSVGMKYTEKGSSSNIERALLALKLKYGYSNAKIIDDHPYNTITSEIHKKRPVYMRARNKGSNTGHAWVCEGSSLSLTLDEYKLYILEDTYDSSEPTEITFIYEPFGTLVTSSGYLRYNWGWEGYCDGYYSGTKVGKYDFCKDKQVIINLYPVK